MNADPDQQLDGEAGQLDGKSGETDGVSKEPVTPVEETAPLVRPLEAVLRRPRIALFPIFLLTAALALGQMVSPQTYSAQGDMVFGSVDVEPNQLPGLVTAGQQLASTYARFVPAIIPAVAERMDMSRGEVAASIEASNVAQSPIITITATASDQETATELAGVAMEEMKVYVDTFAGTNSRREAEVVRKEQTELRTGEFTKARVERDQAEVRLGRLNGQVGDGTPDLTSSIAAAVDDLVDKQAVVDQIQAELDSLDAELADSKANDPLAATVRPLTDPVGTGSDLSGRLTMSIVAGIVLGGLLGVALAMMSANGWNVLSSGESPTSAKQAKSPTERPKRPAPERSKRPAPNAARSKDRNAGKSTDKDTDKDTDEDTDKDTSNNDDDKGASSSDAGKRSERSRNSSQRQAKKAASRRGRANTKSEVKSSASRDTSSRNGGSSRNSGSTSDDDAATRSSKNA